MGLKADVTATVGQMIIEQDEVTLGQLFSLLETFDVLHERISHPVELEIHIVVEKRGASQ